MSITQVWSGTANAYLPSLTGSYNPQPSDSACEFKCLDNYTWDAQTQTCKKEKLENQSCTGLVANAQWRGQGVVTQVWSGTANTYLPSLAGSYNPQGDVNACHFKCERDFTRKNGKCEKVSNGGGSFSGGGSSGGGGTLTKDNCPNGDFSPSYYDGQCGTPGDQEEVVLS